MNDKFQQFFNQVNGKFIETEDAANYAQCMDLVFKWLDFLGIPRDTIRHLYAYQAWTMPLDITRQYFDMIPNGPTNAPVVGDIPIFGQSVGYAGHISIAAPGTNGNDLVSLDQNWGYPKSCRLVTHTHYTGVLGWLHPKNQQLDHESALRRIRDIAYGGQNDGDARSQIKTTLQQAGL